MRPLVGRAPPVRGSKTAIPDAHSPSTSAFSIEAKLTMSAMRRLCANPCCATCAVNCAMTSRAHFRALATRFWQVLDMGIGRRLCWGASSGCPGAPKVCGMNTKSEPLNHSGIAASSRMPR